MSSIFDLTVLDLAQEAKQTEAEWNGKEPGEAERKADIASEITNHLARINALYKELHDE